MAIRPYSANACPMGVGRPSRPNIRSRSYARTCAGHQRAGDPQHVGQCVVTDRAQMRVRIYNVDAGRYIADTKKVCNPDASIKVWTNKFHRGDKLKIILMGNQGSYVWPTTRTERDGAGPGSRTPARRRRPRLMSG